jgi:hypothetical protein
VKIRDNEGTIKYVDKFVDLLYDFDRLVNLRDKSVFLPFFLKFKTIFKLSLEIESIGKLSVISPLHSKFNQISMIYYSDITI